MKYLIVLVMCILASSKVNLQTAFSKKNVTTTSDAIFFNGLIFFFCALLFSGFAINCPLGVWVYSAIFAVLNVLFQVTYTKALTSGNVSLTVMIVNLSMIIPVSVSVLIYHETLTLYKALGVIFTILSFIISTDFKTNEKVNLKWFLLTTTAMIANGLIWFNQKNFCSSVFKDATQGFVATSYILSTVVALAVYLVSRTVSGRKTFKTDKKAIFFALSTAVVLVFFQTVNVYGVSKIEGVFIFPAFSGGSIIFSALSGVLLFKDKLSLRHKISLLTGIVAIVLMNF